MLYKQEAIEFSHLARLAAERTRHDYQPHTGDEKTPYSVDEHHALYRSTGRLFDALLDQAADLCELLPPGEF